MEVIDGLSAHQIIDINCARRKANLSVDELISLLEDDDYVPAKLKARLLFLEAKFERIKKIMGEEI